MITEDSLLQRSLRASTVVTAGLTLTLIACGSSGWAIGLAAGSLLSLLSIFGFVVLVPALFRPGIGSQAGPLMMLLLLMKLPLYAAAIYLATRVPGVVPMAIGGGIVVFPAVLTAGAIGSAARDAALARQALRKAVDPLQFQTYNLEPADSAHETAPRMLASRAER